MGENNCEGVRKPRNSLVPALLCSAFRHDVPYSRRKNVANRAHLGIIDLMNKTTLAEITVQQTIALVDDDRNILTSVSMALEAEGISDANFL